MHYNTDMANFREWFSDALKKSGMKQDALAALVGVSQATISTWKNSDSLDNNTRPRADSLIKLAEVFKVDPYFLFNMVYDLPMPDNGLAEIHPLRAKINRRLDGLDEAILEIIDVQLDQVLIPLVTKILNRARENEKK